MSDLQHQDSGLTHSQLQILVGQRLSPSSPLYNMAFAFVLSGELRPELFQSAWRRVVNASDALRTVIHEREGIGVGELRPPGENAIEVLDFRQEADPAERFRRWSRDRCARALSLDRGLVDSVLVRLEDSRTGWYLNQHHVITDAWSTVLLYRQVATEYARLRDGGEESPGLNLYYPTAEGLRSEESSLAAARAHWRTRLGQGRRIAFYGRPDRSPDTRSTRLTLELDEGQSRAIDRLSAESGFVSLFPEVSRFALLSTLLVSWLYRVSGVSDLGFDAPVAGRPSPESKRALGLFVEMFPFAMTVGPDDTFRELGKKCLTETHQFLQHALPGTSAPSGSTASNVVLNYFPESFGDFAGMPAEVEWVHPGHGDQVHSLRLQVHDFSGSGRYTLHFDVGDEVWAARLRRRYLEHFEAMMRAMLANPDQPIAAVDISTDDERAQLARLNATGKAPLPVRSVSEAFDDQARATPDRIALREGSEEVSFGSLRERTDALAAALETRGVEPGDRVAVVSRRSREAVTALLGILRIGAAYVPIDPSYPPVRVGHILQDCGARMVLLGEGVENPECADGAVVVSITEETEAGHGRASVRGWPGLGALAYLIYTSGSTGQPKGVLIEHGGLADYLQWAVGQYVRGDRLTFPLFTSLAFDLTVTSIFLPLISGGTLEIYREPGGPVDSAIMDVVAANRVDFIKLTPSHLSLMTQVDLSHSRIRRMVVGGEDFKTSLAASISAQYGDRIEIYNEYGPTEAVVGCVAHHYDPRRDVDTRVPIGTPADHVEVQILNQAMSPVPVGVPGELWISRFGLARGYHRLEELTVDRFQPDPERSGGRRYRTGDLVRVRDSGELEYLGRLDRQLKVSGFRVELEEVEAALLSLPGVEQGVVLPRRRGLPKTDARDHSGTCVRCGLSAAHPGASFDDEGVCRICRVYDAIKDRAQSYFRTMEDLRQLFVESARDHHAQYDCMLLLSGGKDSTYALCRLVEMGLSVYAFTLDNGFISDGAKTNMRRVTEQLGVPLEFGHTAAMNAIFRDSLERFSNVCNGCFKTIYTLSTNRASELGIPIVVTGLSRGQMFETRLTEEMFREDRYGPTEVDAAVLAARKAYHRVDDEVARSLDVRLFRDDQIFERIQFVDFYRYCDVGLDEVLSYLERTVPWVRPADTGRSTNCLINDVGIYIHTKERGFHNYALPYSWDVRLGHKTRTAALAELQDDLDVDRVRRTLRDVGYDENRLAAELDRPGLAAFYVGSAEATGGDVRRQLTERLPLPVVPEAIHRIDAIPLTVNGKVDEEALPWAESRSVAEPYCAPVGSVEEYLAESWQRQLGIDRIGSDDNFFELGGTSLGAMEVMIRLCQEFHITLPLETLFEHPTIHQLARVAEERILDDVSDPTAAEHP